MTATTPEEAAANLREADRLAAARIRQAAGRMPYGGLMRRRPLERTTGTGGRLADLTLDDVADYLDELVSVVGGVSEAGARRDLALAEARRDLEAVARVGSLLGLRPALDDPDATCAGEDCDREATLVVEVTDLRGRGTSRRPYCSTACSRGDS